MTRRARWAWLAVALLLAAAVGVPVARWLWPDPAPPGPAAALGPAGPVLLVPGYGGGTDGLQRLATALRGAGRTVEVVAVGDGTGDLRGYAAAVRERAAALVAGGAPSVDLVGFSAGGITVRVAATDPAASGLVRRVVQIAAPNDGTGLAALGSLLGQCPTACQQIRPGSDLLAGLPPANAPGRWLSLWSDTDEVIRPPDSSTLGGATDLPVQRLCPGAVAHSAMVESPATAGIVAAFLAEGRVPAACPAGA